MVVLIDKNNVHRHDSLLEKVYRFRHKFFVEHLGWSALRKSDGREIDQFDDADCIHIVGTQGGEITCYTRLLPTTRPHLLSHVYPDMLAGAVAPIGPAVWEWTRCAVAPEKRDGRKANDPATGRIFLAVAEACLARGIEALLVQTHPLLLTRLLDLGWHARPLALPSEYDGRPVVPIHAGVSEETLRRSQEVFDMFKPVLRSQRQDGVWQTALELPRHEHRHAS